MSETISRATWSKRKSVIALVAVALLLVVGGAIALLKTGPDYKSFLVAARGNSPAMARIPDGQLEHFADRVCLEALPVTIEWHETVTPDPLFAYDAFGAGDYEIIAEVIKPVVLAAREHVC